MSFEELSKLPEYQVEEKPDIKNDEVIKDASQKDTASDPKKSNATKEKKEQEMVSAVGLITDIRKIITKK